MLISALKSLRKLGQPVAARDACLQAAALCLRDGERGPEVLLVTSLTRGRWVLPKGWPMKGRTLAGAALREAWEEAGVQGRVEEAALGDYVYGKLRKGGLAITCRVQVFRVLVEALADEWPEARRRTRRWAAPAEAAGLVDEPGLATLLRSL